MHRVLEIEDDAQITAGTACEPHAADRPGRIRMNRRPQTDAGQIEHDPIRIAQYQQLVAHAAGEIENHTGVVGSRPEPNVAHIGGRRRHGEHEREQETPDERRA